MKFYDQKPPDRKVQTLLWLNPTLMVLIALGLIGFYLFEYSSIGGLSLGIAIFCLVSYLHFRNRTSVSTETMDTKTTLFFIALTVIGVSLAMLNKSWEGPGFYNGVGIALSLVAGICYCIELLLIWHENS